MKKYINFYLFVVLYFFLKASVMTLLSSTEGLLPQNNFMMIKLRVLSDCGLKLERTCLTFILNSRFIYIHK